MRRLSGVTVLIAVATAMTFGCGFASKALCQTQAKDPVPKRIVVEEAQAIKNDNPSFEVKVWTQDNKDSYKPNDTITFHFRANQDCYIRLLDIAPDQSTTQIFPNQFHPDAYVKVEKDKVYTVPTADSRFRFRVSGPSGTELVKAIGTLDKPVQALEPFKDQAKQGFVQIPQAELVMKSLRLELKGQDPGNWAESEISFQITGH
ncbi:MAG: DUF4384 domain-containing protein [Thermodesulfobacteriota bacterium]